MEHWGRVWFEKIWYGSHCVTMHISFIFALSLIWKQGSAIVRGGPRGRLAALLQQISTDSTLITLQPLLNHKSITVPWSNSIGSNLIQFYTLICFNCVNSSSVGPYKRDKGMYKIRKGRAIHFLFNLYLPCRASEKRPARSRGCHLRARGLA